MPTIEERENLLSEVKPKHTGFTPRPIQKLAVKKKPHTMLDVECNHFLHSSRDESTHGIPPLSYRMWLEASKYDPSVPEKPDPQYNSNVWRNFRKQYGFHVNSEGQKVSEMIAAMYPLNIPSPSRVGDYTYEKFLQEISLIKDEKLRKMAIRRTAKDVEEFKKLKLRAEMRNPPVDPEGMFKFSHAHTHMDVLPTHRCTQNTDAHTDTWICTYIHNHRCSDMFAHTHTTFVTWSEYS